MSHSKVSSIAQNVSDISVLLSEQHPAESEQMVRARVLAQVMIQANINLADLRKAYTSELEATLEKMHNERHLRTLM